MNNILLLDTSVGSDNKGDDIIMKCTRQHLADITRNANVFTLPTHVPAFHWYQVARNSYRVQFFTNVRHKFICGTNLLTMNMLTHYPQWNINIFNCGPLRDSVLVGVGAGSGRKMNGYTKMLYKKVLSHKLIHSVRDERTKLFLEDMGFKALNTGCTTLWSLTPEFCSDIPDRKADTVIFTLTDGNDDRERHQQLIDILKANYRSLYFWVQGTTDWEYFHTFSNIENITVVPPSVEEYEKVLKLDADYVGTRLHAGIYAMRHGKRAIILVFDERAREMNKSFNLNTIEINELNTLEQMLHTRIPTRVSMDFGRIRAWLGQFPA